MRRRTLATRGERVRAAAAAIAVNLFLGVAFVTGLALREERQTTESLETFDVAIPPPPPPPTIEQPKEENKAPGPEGSEGRKAEASPVVAQPSPIPRPTPVKAAPVPATGMAASTGNAERGTGAGAGGSGIGSGGGGQGGGGLTPVVLVSGRLSNRDYGTIRKLALPNGQADLILLVGPTGRVEGCRAHRSSGHSGADRILCSLLEQRLRFRPARNANGQPIWQDVHYGASWR